MAVKVTSEQSAYLSWQLRKLQYLEDREARMQKLKRQATDVSISRAKMVHSSCGLYPVSSINAKTAW